jgi:putative Holliday junction resolvase
MARILALDVGERRIGVAISTPEGRLAVPLRVLARRSDDTDVRTIVELARSEGAAAFVVGDPLSLDGSAGRQARGVRSFAQRVAEVSGLPLELWDERLTSVQAERSVVGPRKPAARGAKRRRAPADDVAAAIILQSYLDRHRSDTTPTIGP